MANVSMESLPFRVVYTIRTGSAHTVNNFLSFPSDKAAIAYAKKMAKSSQDWSLVQFEKNVHGTWTEDPEMKYQFRASANIKQPKATSIMASPHLFQLAQVASNLEVYSVKNALLPEHRERLVHHALIAAQISGATREDIERQLDIVFGPNVAEVPLEVEKNTTSALPAPVPMPVPEAKKPSLNPFKK